MLGSVERVLQIVEALAASSEEGATPAEICTRCGLARSTVYRLLSELEASGYVYKSSSKQYFPNFIFARQFDSERASPEAIREACVVRLRDARGRVRDDLEARPESALAP